MRRLVVSAPHSLAWQDFTLAAPPAGQAQIRTHLSAVSISSELSVVAGLPSGSSPAPLGYQTLGVIEAVGPDVSLQAGQRVVCTLGHASHGNILAKNLIPVPHGVSDRTALCSILGEETHKGLRKLSPQPGEQILIAGAGLLGLLSVFNLTRRGLDQVTVLEPDPHRRALALEFGARAAHAPGELPHDQFDVGVECSASPAGFAELLRHLRRSARCGVLSDGNWGALVLPPEFHSRELTLVASSDGEDYPTYAAWLWAHADPVLEKLFEQVVPVGNLVEVFGNLGTCPRPVSVLVDWRDLEAPDS
ncbi:theronine dehydrogenase [Deinococcus cavernae]|uniref:Theronine dehydrogenase n=1 Tax=Deinococcus cavernae TaxID=2320857 RepID=A0A418VAW0_9DEIO|nr:zinc-binding alcohol dehydrogenase [Deinococcus cavernae]RJF73189.1 theronine dehydrogenase [Deinococcus cavernae]